MIADPIQFIAVALKIFTKLIYYLIVWPLMMLLKLLSWLTRVFR